MAIIKFKKGITAPTGLTLAEPAWDYANNRFYIGVTSQSIWVGAEIDNDSNLTSNSSLKIPTQSAVKSYVDANSGSGGAGTKTIAKYTPLDANPPATNFATIDTRNSVPVLEFDPATIESTFFVGSIPQGTILGSTLGAYLHFAGDTATGSTVAWGICMERMTGTFGFSADSFGAGVQVNQILPSTRAEITIVGAAVPVPSGLTTGEAYRLLVRRIANDATNDTAPGDAQLVLVELRNT